MNGDAWGSHNWSVVKGRRVEIEPGQPLIQHHCSRCRRDFVEEPPTGERYAVYVSVFSFHRLPDVITKRWLGELCPGEALTHDIEVRRRLIENR
jgi:Mg-chelatase subunit ChlI